MKILIYIYLLFFYIGNLFSQTIIPGGNVSGTWTTAGSPYHVTGNIIFPSGQTLTINPEEKFSLSRSDFWLPTNGPFGGYGMYSLAIDSNGIIFAGTSYSRIFRSTNNGSNWTQHGPSAGFLSMAVNSVGYIYAGAYPSTVVRSTDNGLTWIESGSGITNNVVRALAITSTDVVFAGTSKGIFRSTDDGDNWDLVYPSNGIIYALVIDTGDNIFAGGESGVFHSVNNGISWDTLNNGLTNPNVMSLSINRCGTIFAGIGGGGLFRSTDGAQNWTHLTNFTSSHGQCIITKSCDTVFVGTWYDGILRSIDTGNTWSTVNTGLNVTFIYSLLNGLDGSIFTGTGTGGIFRSSDNGNNWIQINEGLTAANVEAVAINSGDTIFAGTHIGIYRTTDDGGNWVHMGLRDRWVYDFGFNNGGTIFAGVSAGGVHRSTDGGNNWDQTSLTNRYIYALALKSDNTIFAGGQGFFRSIDNGNNWTQIHTGLADTNIWSIAIKSPDTIFAGTYYGGIFRSTNNGNTWDSVNNGLSNYDVRALVVKSNKYIFAGTWGGGVFRSTNNGDSWTQVNNGLTCPFIPSFTVNSNGDIFVGTYYSGIFVSFDNGNNWTQVNSGLTNYFISGVAVNSSGYVYAGTYDGGVYKSLNSTTTSDGIGTISGKVFHDIEGNGVLDGGDTLLTGWKILLKNSSNMPIDSQQTDIMGEYMFINLTMGTYTVSAIQETSWIQTFPSGTGSYIVTVVNTDTIGGIDFGITYGYKYIGPSIGTWSNGANWTGGIPPGPNNVAIIPKDVTITVDSLPRDTIKALRLEEGGKLEFTPKIGRLKILLSIQIDNSSILQFPITSDTTGLICHKDFINRGTFDPGHSVIIFAGDLPKTITSEGTENEFYKLEINGDSTSSIGNISVNDKLILRKPLTPRDQDTIIIRSGDTSAIQDTGKIPVGTIKRNIDPYETGTYRFESPDTYLKFSGEGTNPCAVSITVLSNKPSGDLYWDSLGGIIDTIKNTIIVDSATKFSKWRMGIPRPTIIRSRADSLYVRIDPIDRTYIIKPECSENFKAEVSLRYNQSDIPGLMQKTGRGISNIASESDLLLFRGPFVADSVHALWNMVSIPLIPDSANKDYLFPTSVSGAFAYIGTYEERTNLNIGEGYWLKFPSAEEVIIEGEDRDSIAIDVQEGWNMIGAISYPVDAGLVISVPSGIIATEFFEYFTAYQLADSIKPFKAYWVKAKASGKLILKANESGIMVKGNISGMPEGLNSINVLDAKKNEAKLYFGTGKNINIARYELPPIPPGGMYDVRFHTDRMVAMANENEENVVSIQITEAEYPVNISWEKIEPLLAADLVVDGKIIEMGSTGDITVTNDTTKILLRFGLKTIAEIPKEYVLQQNYPNPFNPITKFEYQLPVESKVTLKIYNVLGQLVISLVNGVEEAGYKSVDWNASNISSGIYFYRLEAISISDPIKTFTQVKKMILLQ